MSWSNFPEVSIYIYITKDHTGTLMARRKNYTTALFVPVCVICILIWVGVLAQSYSPEPTHHSMQGIQVESRVEGTEKRLESTRRVEPENRDESERN